MPSVTVKRKSAGLKRTSDCPISPLSRRSLFPPCILRMNLKLTARFLELAQTARQEDAPTPGIAPYKGLLFFDESDSELFFGREALTSQLTRHVMDLAMDATTRFLAIVGASGSGKSSLVRAGLAVALQRAGWEVRGVHTHCHSF